MSVCSLFESSKVACFYRGFPCFKWSANLIYPLKKKLYQLATRYALHFVILLYKVYNIHLNIVLYACN